MLKIPNRWPTNPTLSCRHVTHFSQKQKLNKKNILTGCSALKKKKTRWRCILNRWKRSCRFNSNTLKIAVPSSHSRWNLLSLQESVWRVMERRFEWPRKMMMMMMMAGVKKNKKKNKVGCGWKWYRHAPFPVAFAAFPPKKSVRGNTQGAGWGWNQLDQTGSS